LPEQINRYNSNNYAEAIADHISIAVFLGIHSIK
jgi:hypothetical protein